MADDFDWTEDTTVLRSHGDVAVYHNTDGDIVVRQRDPHGEDDALVIFDTRDADRIMAAIRITVRLAKEAKKAGFIEE